jgi:CO dehydrogenase nickel-insertion accessory protein CooC1
MRIGFIAAKGGQGVTTVASAFAVTASAEQPVTLVASDDTRACLGLAEGSIDGGPNLALTDREQVGYDTLVVLDGRAGDKTLLVTRACYMALRRAVNSGLEYDGIVVVMEGHRALNVTDIERALGKPVVAVVPADPVVARAVDAGLLAVRCPQVMREPMEAIARATMYQSVEQA